MALKTIMDGWRGETLSSLEKAELRNRNELAKSRKDLEEAQSLSEQLHATGATDDEIDAVERRVTLAHRQIRRLDMAREALRARRVELVDKQRSELKAKLYLAALDAGAAHVVTAKAAAATAANYTAARNALESEGFAATSAGLPPLPPMVCDFSFSGAVSTNVTSHSPLVQKFEWRLNELMSAQVAG